MTTDNNSIPAPNVLALLPFGILAIFYLVLSLWCGDFYKVSMPVTFLVASVTALCLNRKKTLDEKVDVYAKGMGETNIMIMCLIFILSGMFAAVAKQMGAVDAAVRIAQYIIPARFMLAGIFLVSCAISLAVGTSCGTIAALVPIAIGLIQPLGLEPGLLLGAVIGGAMFGDNMSMISDTTIAATRTQQVGMREKFFANFRMILPAAILCIALYLYFGKSGAPASQVTVHGKDLLLILPYILIFILALCGFNVMLLLFLGTLLSILIGIFTCTMNGWIGLEMCGKGALGMSETLLVAILAGGLLQLIRYNGGVSYLMQTIENKIHTRRGCEFGILLMVILINLFTANNTVAIVIAGPIAYELSRKFGCSGKRVASLLDTGSCFLQGIIPYGAQILIAMGIARQSKVAISSLNLIGHLYYPVLMFFFLLLSIFLSRDAKKNN